MRIYTLGFAGKSAEAFFAALRKAGVEKLVDVRRSHNTLYGGFTRARDLPYLLRQLCGIAYVHEPEFAPSVELLRGHQRRLRENKKDPEAWPDFVRQFTAELESRPIVELFGAHAVGVHNVCLLCTEPKAEDCHRSLLAQYIREHGGGDLEITHL